jgi:hypothetical protein
MNVSHSVATTVFSPSRVAKLSAQCKKLVAPSRYRYDPYSTPVLPSAAAATSAAFRLPTSPKSSLKEVPAHVLNAVAATESPMVVLRAPAPLSTAAMHEYVSVSSPVGAPAAPAPRYAIVRFKHETATFSAPFRIVAGDTVVVEGDRGENIGIVQEIQSKKPAYNVTNKVLRRATDKDRAALAEQRQRELAAVRTTQMLADNLGLVAQIEDAEYQFDLHKLTIFVRRPTKNAFVDFRKLQRGLFREFRCRIWCSYMDEVEAAEAAPRTH